MKRILIFAFASLAFTGLQAVNTHAEQQFLDAAAHGNLTGVEQYLKNGGNINVTFDKTGDTAYHFALANGHASVARYLREHGANDTIKNNRGHTAREMGRLFAQARQAKREAAENGADQENRYAQNQQRELQYKREVNAAHREAEMRARPVRFGQPL